MITVRWYDEAQSILYLGFSGEWTWDEYDHAMEKSYALVASVPHRVDAIIHIMDEAAIKVAPGSIQRWRDDLLQAPPNFAHLVHVTKSSFFTTMMTAFLTLLPFPFMNHIHIVSSLAEAEARIASIRSS